MARYKPIDTGMKLLPIDLSRQLLPGTFEHALSHLLDQWGEVPSNASKAKSGTRAEFKRQADKIEAEVKKTLEPPPQGR